MLSWYDKILKLPASLNSNLGAFYLRIQWAYLLDKLDILDFWNDCAEFHILLIRNLKQCKKTLFISHNIFGPNCATMPGKILLFENQIWKSLELEKRVGTLSFGNSDNMMSYPKFSKFSCGQMSQVDQSRAAELKLKIVCEKWLFFIFYKSLFPYVKTSSVLLVVKH